MQQPSTSTPSKLSPSDIRRRVNDLDGQVRQGLEEGTVRLVMKRIGPVIKQLMEYQRGGTDEEKAAFPRRLFLYDFLRAWNKPDFRHDSTFIDRQMAAVLAFDAGPSPVPPAPTRPPKRPRTPEALIAGPSKPAASAPTRTQGFRDRPQVSLPLPLQPTGVRIGPPGSQRRVEVHLPPRKFRDVAKDGEEEEDEEDEEDEEEEEEVEVVEVVEKVEKVAPKRKVKAQQAEPAPPRRNKVKAKAAPKRDPSPPPPRRRRVEPEPEPDSESESDKHTKKLHKPPCERCVKGGHQCLKHPKGGACMNCKKHKYGCEYSVRGKRKPGDDEDEDDEGDGAESDSDSGLAKKAAGTGSRIKKEKEPTQSQRRKASKTVKKGKVQFEEEEEQPKKMRAKKGKGVEVHDEDEEPRAKRARVRTYADRDLAERLGKLEAKVEVLAEESKTSQQVATRLTRLEKNVERFTDLVGNFLGQICIDDGVRLVRDDRRISDLTLDFDPDANAGLLDMEMNAAYHSDPGSAAPDSMSLDLGDASRPGTPMLLSPVDGTTTTPSEAQDEERMERVVVFPGVAANPTHPPLPEPDSTMAPPDPDSSMAPPPHPTVNVIPATPQQSQEGIDTHRLLVPPPATSSEGGIELGTTPPPTRTRSRSRSRTRGPSPLGDPPLTSTSGLQPPMTRARSRSKTPL